MTGEIALGLTSILAGVFGFAAFGKLRSRASFADFVESVENLTRRAYASARLVAIVVASSEVAAVVALALPATRPLGFAMACLLLAAFTVVLTRAALVERRTPCNCFGSATSPVGLRHVVRNGLLLVVAAAGAVLSLLPTPAPGPAGLVVSLGLGIVIAALVARWDDIVDLFRLT